MNGNTQGDQDTGNHGEALHHLGSVHFEINQLIIIWW